MNTAQGHDLGESCIEDNVNDQLELIGLSPMSNEAAQPFDSIEERLEEMHRSPTSIDLPIVQIKTEFIPRLNDTQSSDVIVIDVPPEVPIIIEDDMNTQEMFEFMSTDHSETDKCCKRIEITSNKSPEILLTTTTTNQENYSGAFPQDWLNSNEFQNQRKCKKEKIYNE